MTPALRLLLLLLLALAAGTSAADELQPVQDPTLRIETGMHTGGIWRLGVSGDGKLLVTSSEDKTIRLWSTEDGSLLRTIRVPIAYGPEGKLYSVAISPDGRTIAAGGWDAYYWRNYWSTYAGHYVYLYDSATGDLIGRLGPVSGNITDLEFNRDGTRLAAALSNAAGVRVWAAPFTALPGYDRDFASGSYGVAFGPNNELAATSDDGFVRLYDSNMQRIAKVTVASGPSPRSVAFSPDGSKIAVSQAYRVGAEILSGKTLAPLAAIDTRAFNTSLLATAWSNDGQTLYLAGGYADKDWDYPIVAYKDGKFSEFKSPQQPKGGINDIKVLPDGSIAYVSHDPSFGIFDPQGKLRLVHPQVTVDMRNKYGGRFFNSPDATSVWFGLQLGALDPWVVDINHLTFNASPDVPAGFIQPVTDSLPIEHWNNEFQTTLDNQVLPMDAAEMARSLAIMPDKLSFILGTDWSITRFDSGGKVMWRKQAESFVWGVSLSADGQLLVAAQGDGTLRWYRTSDGTELLAFFVNAADHKWIAWTPTGYYAASAGGEDLMGWQFNGKTWDDKPDFFPASRFRKQFYRPDIVQLVLILRDEARAIETANNLVGGRTSGGEGTGNGQEGIRGILPGVVEFAEDSLVIETKTTDIQLYYRLRSPSGREITRLEVLIDGRPVTPRGVVAVDQSADAKVLPLTIPPRDVEVTLIAYIGDQPGVPASIPIKWKGQVQTQKKPNLYALMIGISDYENKDLKLRYADKDAEALGALLAKQQGLYYDTVETTYLLNGDATEKRIQVELSRLRSKASPDDNVIVFMAGHGYTDVNQDFYFLPTGADLAPDMLAATAIDGDIIRKGLARIPGKVILFMDACHAGNGIQGNTSLVDMSGISNGLSDGASLVMFASSTGREVSYESPQWGHGAFTEALLEILADPSAYGDDGKLSISELDEQLTTRVEALTEGKQTPVMTKPGAVKRFFLAAL
jgi:WD40 repeat protein